jgi:glutamate 5-kinase
MPTLVVKLGSSVVAEANGDLRPGVLDRVCDEVAALHGEGVDVVIVTSGAIARGMRLLELPIRPRAIEDLQAASAVGQGKLYRVYDELLRDRGLTSAQVLLTFFDMSARTHYVNARRTLRKLLDWRIVPVINENDTTTTDQVSFGDNDFLAAQVAVLVGRRPARAADRHRRALHRRPAARPGATLVDRSRTPRRSACWRSGTRRRRWAPAACARRWWRPTWPPRRGSRR